VLAFSPTSTEIQEIIQLSLPTTVAALPATCIAGILPCLNAPLDLSSLDNTTFSCQENLD